MSWRDRFQPRNGRSGFAFGGLAIAAALALVVVGLVMGFYNERAFRAQKTREVAVQAQILAASVTAALAFDDRKVAQEYVEALSANPEVEAAGVYDTQGRLLAGNARPDAPPPPAVATGAPASDGRYIVVTAPVRQGQSLMGSVYLRTLVEPLPRRLARYAGVALLLVMAALLIVSGYTSINAVVKAELFPAQVRALGVGLPYALTVSVFGGTAEYIALWFKQQGLESGFYWYATAVIACSLLVYLLMRDTRRHSRIDAESATH